MQSPASILKTFTLTVALMTLLSGAASAIGVPAVAPDTGGKQLQMVHYNGTCHSHDDELICDDYTIPNATRNGKGKRMKAYKSGRKSAPHHRTKRLKRH